MPLGGGCLFCGEQLAARDGMIGCIDAEEDERAGEQGDEEVLRKLTEYRAGLEQKLGY